VHNSSRTNAAGSSFDRAVIASAEVFTCNSILDYQLTQYILE